MVKALTLDEALERVGSFGQYQLCILFCMGILTIPTAIQCLLAAFIAAEPGWRCVRSSSLCTLNGTYYPGSKEYDFRCSIPRSEWKFTTSFTSVVTEWDLVCSKAIYAAVPASVTLLGFFPGSLLFGFTADRYGRKSSIFVTTALSNIAGLLGSFSPNFWCLCVARFFAGVGAGGFCLVGVILLLELCGVKHRGSAGVGVQVFFPTGMVILPLLAYLCPEWRTLSVVAASFGLPVVCLWGAIPESPRWMMLHGRVHPTEKLLRSIATCNNRVVPREPLQTMQLRGNSHRITSRIAAMFGSCRRFWTLFSLWWTWFVTSMVYYGVSISSVTLGGNIYLSFGINSAIEIPAIFIGIYIMNRCGRKSLVVGGLLAAAVFSIICGTAFPVNERDSVHTVFRIIFSMLAKAAISPMFCSLYVFSSELIPTFVRSIGVGSCSAVGRFGSFAAPYLLLLVHVNTALPYSLMGVFTFIASMLCLTLKETYKLPTPDTYREEIPVSEERVPLLKSSSPSTPTDSDGNV